MKILALSAFAAALAAASPALAAGTTAMSEADCKAAWQAADVNRDGMVSEDEAPRYFAFYRLNDTTLAAGTLDQALFLKDCQAGLYSAAAAEQGAPFEGANSFTETQAKDRIISQGGSNVSALNKDDKGIWRGTASVNGQNMNVALDYKGNVVFGN